MAARAFLALVVVVLAPAVVAHEGHGATPAHVHPASGGAVDVGAAVIALVVGAGALAATRRRSR